MNLTSLWNTVSARQRYREPPTTTGITGGIAQERVYVGTRPQDTHSLDPIAYGADTPSRPARYPIAILTGMDPQTVAEGRFTAGVVADLTPHAAYPLTRQTPQRQRVNIPVPPHIALGSYYESWEGMYG